MDNPEYESEDEEGDAALGDDNDDDDEANAKVEGESCCNHRKHTHAKEITVVLTIINLL